MAADNRRKIRNLEFLGLYTYNPSDTDPKNITTQRLIDNMLADFHAFTVHVVTLKDERRPTNGPVTVHIPYGATYTITIDTFLAEDRKCFLDIYNTYGAGPYVVYYKLDAETNVGVSTSYVSTCMIDETTYNGKDFISNSVVLNLQEKPVRHIVAF